MLIQEASGCQDRGEEIWLEVTWWTIRKPIAKDRSLGDRKRAWRNSSPKRLPWIPFLVFICLGIWQKFITDTIGLGPPFWLSAFGRFRSINYGETPAYARHSIECQRLRRWNLETGGRTTGYFKVRFFLLLQYFSLSAPYAFLRS